MSDECQCADCQCETVAELPRWPAVWLLTLVGANSALTLQLIAEFRAEMAASLGLEM